MMVIVRKIIYLILIAFFSLNISMWMTFYEDNCINWTYADYYKSYSNSNTVHCWYFKYVYIWKKYTIADYWEWSEWKERIIWWDSTGHVYNLWWYSILYDSIIVPHSNWISKEADSSSFVWDKPSLGVLENFKLNNNQNISLLDRHKPIAIIKRNIANYIVDNTLPDNTDGLYKIPASYSFYYNTIISNWDGSDRVVKVSDTSHSIKKTSTNLRSEHNELYLLLPAWCWDSVVSNWEQCDNWTSNFDWSWNPVIKNGIACDNTCHIMKPTCWSAAKTYGALDTSFDGNLCAQYSSLSWSNPVFPNQWWSSSWVCSLWSQTINCSASRWSWWWWSWGWNHCWTADGTQSNTKPTSQLCTAWTLNWTDPNWYDWSWNWDCWSNHCSAPKPCAVDWTCSVWTCWSLNWQTIDANSSSIINKIKKPSDYHSDFCNGDSVLSYNYDANLNNWNKIKQFNWTCWLANCSLNINYNIWKIKIYGSYSWNVWWCPECNWFDQETWDNIKIKFLSDYDTTYTRSIMSWDYLPFGWILPNYQSDYFLTCDSSNVWKYNKNSVKVRFKAFKWDVHLVYQTLEYNWFNGWVNLAAFSDNSVLWQLYIPANKTRLFSMWENSINGYISYRQVCKWVDNDWDWTVDTYTWWNDINSDTLFTTEKFTVTDHYMIQDGTAFSNTSNVDLNFNWNSLSDYGVDSVNSISSYDTWSLSKVLRWFIEKYKQYAVGNFELLWDTTTSFKKVLTQEVYYKDLWWGSLILWNMEATVPTTILIENGDVTINWNIKWSILLVVKNWKIKIENTSMNLQTMLDGYYITDK